MGYDAWLEAPFQRAQEEGDAFVDWCENEGIEPDDAGWAAWEAAQEEAAEDAAERRAEARMEAAAEAAMFGDW